MFKCIEVYRYHKKVATQYFKDSISIIPKKGDHIQINGMAISYRVTGILYDYRKNTIQVVVE